MDEHEYCALCDDPTGRSGEDSLYSDDGNGGPYCEECYDQYLILDRLPRLESRIAELESQLAAAERRAEENAAETRETRALLLAVDPFVTFYGAGIHLQLIGYSAAIAQARAEREKEAAR